MDLHYVTLNNIIMLGSIKEIRQSLFIFIYCNSIKIMELCYIMKLNYINRNITFMELI